MTLLLDQKMPEAEKDNPMILEEAEEGWLMNLLDHGADFQKMPEAEKDNPTMMVEEPHYLSHDHEVDELLSDFLNNMPSKLSWSPPKNSCLSESLWVFWSPDHDESQLPQTLFSCIPNSVPYSTPTINREIKEKIKFALQHLRFVWDKYEVVLFQFWSPITIEGRCFLTTSDQPFGISWLDKRLGSYRKHSLDYKCVVDGESIEELGLPGRVFRKKFPEFSPNVRFYSSKEYPQRNHAVSCNFQQILAFPVIEPSNQCCVGVFELVYGSKILLYGDEFSWTERINKELEMVALEGFYCGHFSRKKICDNEGLQNVLDEIFKVLKVVCKTHELPLAQTWIPCWHCTAVAYGGNLEKGCTSFNVIMTNVMSTGCAPYYPFEDWESRDRIHRIPLQKGQGVAGRAYLSHGSCFCTDVTQFSITEYPMAHYAREFGLAGCFAICLRSTYTGDDDYILEFFLPPSNIDGEDLTNLLDSLLTTMKQNFQSFKVASGVELGEELCVDVIKLSIVRKPNSFKICQTARSLPRPEALLDSSDQQSVVLEGHVINKGWSMIDAEQSDITDADLEREATINTSDRECRKVTTSIRYEDLKQHFGRPLKDAADSLRVSRSTLKRICRQHDIPRWPSHKRNKANPSLSCSDPPPEQAVATVVHTIPHVIAMQNVRTMTVKATYGDDIIKFQLSFSSGMVELEELVAKSLKLNVGTFRIKYLDNENDWVLIGCNENLQECMSSSRSLGQTIIRMMVEPVAN